MLTRSEIGGLTTRHGPFAKHRRDLMSEALTSEEIRGSLRYAQLNSFPQGGSAVICEAWSMSMFG